MYVCASVQVDRTGSYEGQTQFIMDVTDRNRVIEAATTTGGLVGMQTDRSWRVALF